MSSVRAFLAVPLPGALKNALSVLQNDLMRHARDIRWSRPESLHLTLHFFGRIPQENLEKIVVSMLSIKGCHQPFLVDVIGLGAFPSLQRPRVVWLGLTPQDQLRQLHRDCQQSLSAAGFDIDFRPYTPHLTIGRARKQTASLARLSQEIGDTLIGQLPIDRLVLYESRLQAGGAQHIPLFTAGLGDENHLFR